MRPTITMLPLLPRTLDGREKSLRFSHASLNGGSPPLYFHIQGILVDVAISDDQEMIVSERENICFARETAHQACGICNRF